MAVLTIKACRRRCRDMRSFFLGIGHTNAHVLRLWRMQPPANARLTCLSNFAVATYSGMLSWRPGRAVFARQMEIDLVRFCEVAGARLIVADVDGLDVEQRQVRLHGRPPLHSMCSPSAWLGAEKREGIEADDMLLPIKPMQTFLPRLEASREFRRGPDDLARSRRCTSSSPAAAWAGWRMYVLLPRMRSSPFFGQVSLELTLVHSHERLVPGVTDRTAERVERTFSPAASACCTAGT